MGKYDIRVEGNKVIVVAPGGGRFEVPADAVALNIYGHGSGMTYREALGAGRLALREDELDNVDGTAYGALYVPPVDGEDLMRAKVRRILTEYIFADAAAGNVAAAFLTYMAYGPRAAYEVLVYAVAKSELLKGPLNWVNHLNCVVPRVDMETFTASAEYRGETYIVDLPEIVR